VVYETGLPLREFIHEGNEKLWKQAIADPAREAAWVLIAEGDALDRLRDHRFSFPEGFVPVTHFGRVTVYRRATDLEPRRARMEPPHGGDPID
jgi:hypothetical protein